MSVTLLAVGDIVGKSGLEFLGKILRKLKSDKGADYTVVNGENAANNGITPRQADEIFAAGADVITLGNHTWGKREILPYLDDRDFIIRPLNFAPQTAGHGFCVVGDLCVVNLIGRCNMNFGPDNPFHAVEKVLKTRPAKYIVVDIHAEATSEKLAMCYYLDGRVSAVFGTHTHVQTSDCRIFPKGTGYITDLGMTGPVESVLGIRPEQSVSFFLGNPPERFATAPGICKIEGAVFRFSEETGLCEHCESFRIQEGS
ncbi:MAG: TIGR00282 family metallophosphoesterase [Oscillospiraceae bacterium]|jgi:metallophosphoesterase (TIGR00282 family)